MIGIQSRKGVEDAHSGQWDQHVEGGSAPYSGDYPLLVHNYFLRDLPHVYLLPWVQTAVSPVDTYVLSCKNSISSDLKINICKKFCLICCDAEMRSELIGKVSAL